MARPDFPKSLTEFVKMFPDDEACWEYLVASRWPDGVTCPEGEPVWFNEKRKLFECKDGHQFSVTATLGIRFTQVVHRHPPYTGRTFSRWDFLCGSGTAFGWFDGPFFGPSSNAGRGC